ncbi:hypothetical protein OE903_04035 [Bacillus sp. B6(2022)]|nr:hypothetical protein [Bacillus sp. B6(2022)]
MQHDQLEKNHASIHAKESDLAAERTERNQYRQSQHLTTAQSIAQFKELSRILSPLDILKSQRDSFEKRTERLQAKEFTLALFGAFSSGKSSLPMRLLDGRCYHHLLRQQLQQLTN